MQIVKPLLSDYIIDGSQESSLGGRDLVQSQNGTELL